MEVEEEITSCARLLTFGRKNVLRSGMWVLFNWLIKTILVLFNLFSMFKSTTLNGNDDM